MHKRAKLQIVLISKCFRYRNIRLKCVHQTNEHGSASGEDPTTQFQCNINDIPNYFKIIHEQHNRLQQCQANRCGLRVGISKLSILHLKWWRVNECETLTFWYSVESVMSVNVPVTTKYNSGLQNTDGRLSMLHRPNLVTYTTARASQSSIPEQLTDVGTA